MKRKAQKSTFVQKKVKIIHSLKLNLKCIHQFIQIYFQWQIDKMDLLDNQNQRIKAEIHIQNLEFYNLINKNIPSQVFSGKKLDT